MTRTYDQIKKQIESLEREAEALRSKEVKGVVDRIKVAIKHYGLTAEQLGFGVTSPVPKSKRSLSVSRVAATPRAKFSDGSGRTWSGIGKRPGWLRAALEAGRTLDEFLTDVASGAASSGRRSGKRRKYPVSTVVYRDGAGNSWTGRGPQPRWMKEALASGKTLADLRG